MQSRVSGPLQCPAERPSLEELRPSNSTITLYGTEDGWEALEKKNLSLQEHRALATGLAGTVQKIHAFWLEQRRRQIADGTLPEVVRREPIRNPNKVGRNEPCPCGSGKKFKQCHGSAADRLH